MAEIPRWRLSGDWFAVALAVACAVAVSVASPALAAPLFLLVTAA